jgi:hypothetical protein
MLVTAAYKNRRRRKRLRRRAESRTAEATGDTSHRPTRRVFGAWRPQCGQLDRHDLVLVRKACRGDWDVPESVRRAIIGQVCELIGSSRIWLCLSAFQTVIAIERQNQRREHAAITRLRATPEGRRRLESEIAAIVQGRRTGASVWEIGNQ